MEAARVPISLCVQQATTTDRIPVMVTGGAEVLYKLIYLLDLGT